MANEHDAEQERWAYEQNRLYAEKAHDDETEFGRLAIKSAVDSGNFTLRTLVFINGGAAVAILAFIGTLVSADGAIYANKLVDIASPLIWFVWGVASATFGSGMAYLTNYCTATSSALKSRHYEHPFVRNTTGDKWWRRGAAFFQLVAISAALFSLYSFVEGMIEVQSAIFSSAPKS